MGEHQQPLVSVLMTAFNREYFIREAIESVLKSTYKNFELIICDDCSTDGTVEIAHSYSKDERIKIYVNECNLQQFQNRNNVARFAKGKYLKYVDSDDIIYAHSLEMMVNIMESFPDAGLGFCHTSGNSKWPLPHCYTSSEVFWQHYFGGGILYTGPIGTIIRKDVFDGVGGFDLYGMPSDNHFLLKVAAKYPVVSMYRDLIWWRSHDNQAFNGETDDINIFMNLKWNLDILLNVNCPLNEKDRLQAIRNCKKIFLYNIGKKLLSRPGSLPVIIKLMQNQQIKFGKLVNDLVK